MSWAILRQLISDGVGPKEKDLARGGEWNPKKGARDASGRLLDSSRRFGADGPGQGGALGSEIGLLGGRVGAGTCFIVSDIAVAEWRDMEEGQAWKKRKKDSNGGLEERGDLKRGGGVVCSDTRGGWVRIGEAMDGGESERAHE
jgi:hypothetical protein